MTILKDIFGFMKKDPHRKNTAENMTNASTREQLKRPKLGGTDDTPRQHRLNKEISPPLGSMNIDTNKFNEREVEKDAGVLNTDEV